MKIKNNKFKLFLFVLIAWPSLHILYTIIDGLYDSQKNVDIAVILGNTVNKDGTLSTRLEKRMECGLALYRSGRIKKILVSGGLGKEGHYEGNKMRDYLLKNNVPDIVIVVDNLGNNTLATVKNTLKLKDSIGFKSIIVVSQYFHLARTKMLFRKDNFKNVSSASPWYFEARDIYSLAREFVAYYAK
jgi:vancomycin permeability regulator SanA